MTYDAFYPGREWLDTDGNLIQAHAGYMFYENDTFYWYGENKERSETEWEVWHWGVRLYSSKDLYNWKSEGIILPPELTDTTHPMYFNSKMDRPHILYNEKTGETVLMRGETRDRALPASSEAETGATQSRPRRPMSWQRADAPPLGPPASSLSARPEPAV